MTKFPVVVVLAGLVFLALSDVNGVRFEWQGPTPWFKVLDTDRDRQVSRPEWEARYGTSIYSGAAFEFDRSDCDQNGRLSWREYFRGKMKRQQCERPGPLSAVLAGAPEATPYVEQLPLLALPLELTDGAAPLTDHAEADVAEGDVARVSLSCGPLTQAELRRTIRGVSGVLPALTCEVDNRADALVVTLLLLYVESQRMEATGKTWHAKSVRVPAGSQQSLTIFLEHGTQSARAGLLGIRGRPSSE